MGFRRAILICVGEKYDITSLYSDRFLHCTKAFFYLLPTKKMNLLQIAAYNAILYVTFFNAFFKHPYKIIKGILNAI